MSKIKSLPLDVQLLRIGLEYVRKRIKNEDVASLFQNPDNGIIHKVLAVIVTRDKNTRSGFLHFRMCLIPGENLAPILGRSPGAPQ